MEILWFCLVAVMIAMYVVLDGFDLGAGIVHLWVARTDSERRTVLRAIGPVWDGNEVWLLAGGGTLFFAFPALYASSFSGFYLPLMVVLWLLIARACAVEFRNHLNTPTWTPLWDATFGISGALLAVFFGAALGNVVRGVPLNAQGEFFLPLWTSFDVHGEVGILDWYTILVGVFALFTLMVHGALWVAHKTEGEVAARAVRAARLGWYGVAALTVVATIATFQIQPQVPASFAVHRWGYVFPALALAGLLGVKAQLRGWPAEGRAFLASCLFIVGMLTSAAFGVFPYVLPSNTDPLLGLTIYNTATGQYGLAVGLGWFVPGMLLATGYTVFVYRHFAGKVKPDVEGY
jgi:cytochrome bd ubiquinol oxidase subunit II